MVFCPREVTCTPRVHKLPSRIMRIMRVPDEKTCVFLLSCLLCSVLLLAHDAEPPFVRIEDLGHDEDGMAASIEGMLASLHKYDSGTESMVLGDTACGATARVVCSPGRKEMPSDYLSLGDIARVEGEITYDGTMATVYCDSDSVLLVSRSARVLDVAVLSSCWELLMGDRFNVTGVLEESGQGSWYVLRDLAGSCSIEARSSIGAGSLPTEAEVIVDCTMFLDDSSMAFILVIWSVKMTY